MAWIILAVAGVLEVIWATSMKASNGFTVIGPSILTIVAAIGSFCLLALAMRSLPLGTSYMVWTGIGACGAFIVGIFLYGEPVSPARLLAAGMIVLGMGLMKVAA